MSNTTFRFQTFKSGQIGDDKNHTNESEKMLPVGMQTNEQEDTDRNDDEALFPLDVNRKDNN